MTEPLLPGKLPPDLLASLLASATIDDPRVLVGPRVGVDAAVIDIGDRRSPTPRTDGGVGALISDRFLVVKSDPITFATEAIGWYAVQVNANDLAVMGATP